MVKLHKVLTEIMTKLHKELIEMCGLFKKKKCVAYLQ